MMRAETGPTAVIVMSSQIVITEGTFYCPENTAKAVYEFDELVNNTTVDYLDNLFVGPTDFGLKDWQAEVWIPDGILPTEFTQIWFRNEAERDTAVEACAGFAANLPKPIQFGFSHWFRF
jgi:hypothetical protein